MDDQRRKPAHPNEIDISDRVTISAGHLTDAAIALHSAGLGVRRYLGDVAAALRQPRTRRVGN